MPQELMTYWGYKFETLSLLPAPWDAMPREYIENRHQHQTGNHEQYCSVVQSGIGDISMVLGGEVDAVWDSKPSSPTDNFQQTPPINWVELKTAAEIPSNPTPQNLAFFDRKLLKFWAQSFLLGVPRIVIGFRSQRGILLRLQHLQTTQIPALVRQRAAAAAAASAGRVDPGGTVVEREAQPTWDHRVCICFAGEVLRFLKEHMKEGTGVWKVRRRERSGVIEVFRVEESGTGDILSREFVEWRTGGGAALGKQGEADGIHG